MRSGCITEAGGRAVGSKRRPPVATEAGRLAGRQSGGLPAWGTAIGAGMGGVRRSSTVCRRTRPGRPEGASGLRRTAASCRRVGADRAHRRSSVALEGIRRLLTPAGGSAEEHGALCMH